MTKYILLIYKVQFDFKIEIHCQEKWDKQS